MVNSDEKTLPADPYALFDEWFERAKEKEINDPNAMAVACLDEDDHPSARIVLMKHHDARGFCFFTNYDSRKGRGLTKHPKAEACFHWKSIEKQVRITGAVEKVSENESDAYYNSRPRPSRIGAWASLQTQKMDSPDVLAERNAEFEEKFKDEEVIPRPPHWGGFRIIPHRMEFWEGHPFRLHDRWFYELKDGEWVGSWLFP